MAWGAVRWRASVSLILATLTVVSCGGSGAARVTTTGGGSPHGSPTQAVKAPRYAYIDAYCRSVREFGRLSSRWNGTSSNSGGANTPVSTIKRRVLPLANQLEAAVAGFRASLAALPAPEFKHGDEVAHVIDENLKVTIGGIQRARGAIASQSVTDGDARTKLLGETLALAFALFPLAFGPVNLKKLSDGPNYFASGASPHSESLKQIADANPGYAQFMQTAVKRPGCGDLVGDKKAEILALKVG